MHGCYVSARNRDAACTSRSDARAMQSQSRTLRLAAARARSGAPANSLLIFFAAAKRPKNDLTTGSRSLSSTSTNLGSWCFREPAPARVFISGLPAAYGFSFDLLFNFNRKKKHSASAK